MQLPIVGQEDRDFIEFTDKAVEIMKSTLEEANDPKLKGVRVAIAGGGCSGFMYDMFLEDEISDEDKVFDCNGLKVYIDVKSLPFLKGVKVDYKQSLKESGFTFTNPNATKTCGCGTSFTV